MHPVRYQRGLAVLSDELASVLAVVYVLLGRAVTKYR